MIRRVFCYIAGIDPKTLQGCPATDQLWAIHLGFSLLLSFLVVLGISFHATGYVIPNIQMRLVVCMVIALTVFMFDRALYQSDWFYQGIFKTARTLPRDTSRESHWNLFWRLLRISIRLAISIGLASVLSVFVELAVFSDTITEKIQRDYLLSNKSSFDKIKAYEASLDAEIRDRYTSIRTLENQYQQEIRGVVPLDAAAQSQFDYLADQKKRLDTQEQELQRAIRENHDSVRKYQEDMNAEELGQRLRAHNSGLEGRGSRYEFAKKQKALYEGQQAAFVNQLAQLEARRKSLSQAQESVVNQSAERRNEDRVAQNAKRNDLEKQIALQNIELKTLQSTRNEKLEQFRFKEVSSPNFQKLKNDPLSRMTAYQQLKRDPHDGETITLFSLMTKFLIIFLEVVPVLAKMFFSPPSVYAIKVQALVEQASLELEKQIVEREQRVVEQEIELQNQKEAYAEAQRERENANLRHGLVQETLNKAHDAIITDFPSRGTPAAG